MVIFFFLDVQKTHLFNLPQKRVEIRMSFRKELEAISCVILLGLNCCNSQIGKENMDAIAGVCCWI